MEWSSDREEMHSIMKEEINKIKIDQKVNDYFEVEQAQMEYEELLKEGMETVRENCGISIEMIMEDLAYIRQIEVYRLLSYIKPENLPKKLWIIQNEKRN